MPGISRFLGIVIAMYYNAKYSGSEIKVNIDTGEVIAGRVPPRAQRLVFEWHSLHRDELMEHWTLAQERRPLKMIAPLE